MANRSTGQGLGLTRLLGRGESAVASAGLALVLILAGAMITAGWWSAHNRRQSLQQARIDEVRAAGDVLADVAEAMLRGDDLSALRRVVMSTATAHELTQCRVTLPDGSVLADSDPGRITVTTAPASWGGVASPVVVEMHDQRMALSYPLTVPGRGAAKLEIQAEPRALVGDWSLQAGVGAVGVTALIALLILYRHLRQQIRPLQAVGESLAAFGAGETAMSALTVNPSLGQRAVEWNRVLADRESQLERNIDRDVRAAVKQRSGSVGELADACNALSQGLMVIDDQMRVAYLNGAAAVFLGGKRDDLLHQVIDVIGIDSQIVEAIHHAIAGPSRHRRTLEIGRENGQGEAVLRFGIRPITRGEAPAAVIVIDDITQQRVAEQSRNTFIAQATHELRTPLTNIRLYVETALEAGEADARLRGECLNVINSESTRLERLVSDMLSISEIEAGSMHLKLDDVRLDAMFDELEKDYQAQARDKRIRLTFNLPPKLPVIQGERERLSVIFQNLLGNALKYTEGEGSVEVAVETSSDVLMVEVKDTGVGISEQDLPHIFDKFYRAEDRRVREIKGTGLGLSLAREIARLHGGDITVESQLNRGTTFTLTLPICAEAM